MGGLEIVDVGPLPGPTRLGKDPAGAPPDLHLFKRSAHSAGPVHMSVVVHVPGLGSPKKRQFRNNFENCSMIFKAPGTNFDARGVLFGFLETLGVSVDGRRKSKSSEASLF